jgi:hypothetical protein
MIHLEQLTTSTGTLTFLIVIQFLLTLFATGLLVDYLDKKTTNNIYNTFGNIGLFVSSLIGTPIHELGHLIMALIFKHKIIDFKLFAFKTSGTLGYVNTQHDSNSKYQTVGCFFIGIGPIFSCMTVILASMYFLLPETFISLKALINTTYINSSYNLVDTFKNMLLILFNSSNFTSRNFWLFLAVLLMVATHMSLSTPDIKTASSGLTYFIILLFSIIAVAIFLGKTTSIFYFLNLVIFTCILVAAVSVVAWLISSSIRKCKM